MPKKANKKRKKPSPAQAAQNKKQTPEAGQAKKSKKPLIIAIAAVAAVCAVAVALIAAGVFKRHESIDGSWTSPEDGFGITVEGDRMVDSDGGEYRLEYSGDVITIFMSDNASEGAGEYVADFAFVIEDDTLLLYNTGDADREYPERVFVRSETPADSGGDTESSSGASSEGSDEPDDGIPDFETLGIADDLMKTGVVYSLTTKDYTEDGVTIKGTLEVAGYEKTALTEKALTFAEDMGVDLTGYESRAVTLKVNFDSMTADVAYIAADYYNAKLFEDNFEPIGVSAGGTQYAKSKIKYNGAEYAVYMLGDAGYYEDETVYKSTDVWEAIVPEGYDGVCFGYYNTQLLDSIPDGVSNAYSYDYYKKGDMYYFRCA